MYRYSKMFLDLEERAAEDKMFIEYTCPQPVGGAAAVMVSVTDGITRKVTRFGSGASYEQAQENALISALRGFYKIPSPETEANDTPVEHPVKMTEETRNNAGTARPGTANPGTKEHAEAPKRTADARTAAAAETNTANGGNSGAGSRMYSSRPSGAENRARQTTQQAGQSNRNYAANRPQATPQQSAQASQRNTSAPRASYGNQNMDGQQAGSRNQAAQTQANGQQTTYRTPQAANAQNGQPAAGNGNRTAASPAPQNNANGFQRTRETEIKKRQAMAETRQNAQNTRSMPKAGPDNTERLSSNTMVSASSDEPEVIHPDFSEQPQADIHYSETADTGDFRFDFGAYQSHPVMMSELVRTNPGFIRKIMAIQNTPNTAVAAWQRKISAYLAAHHIRF